MQKITLEFLKEKKACQDGYDFVASLKTESSEIIFKALIEHNLQWANWLIARVLDRKNRIRYAVFAAEQVIDIYEKKYPDKKKPRNAIEAAKKVLEDDSEINRNAAAYAAYAASASASAAADAACSSASASDAAYAAYSSASAAADAACSSASAAADAAYSSAYAASASDAAYAAYSSASASAEKQKMKLKIVHYGMDLAGIKY
jgi:hypothetical protein